MSTRLTTIADLESVIIQQTASIADLEKRVDKHSRNRSTPPSSHGLTKPPMHTESYVYLRHQ